MNIKEETLDSFTKEQIALYNDIGTELMCGVKDPVEIARVLELLAYEMRTEGITGCR